MGRAKDTACYRLIGAELKKRREAAGITAREVGEHAEWDRSKVSRIENGLYSTTVVDAIYYLGACGIYRGQARDLLRLCREAERQLGYWLDWPRLDDSFSSLIFHEQTAVRSVSYEPLLVPGLLQTRPYAQARIAYRATAPEEVEPLVVIRMERQLALYRRNAGRFTFFVHEQALRLPVGSPEIMHEQMLNLVFAAALDNVTVRVIPADAGEKTLSGGPFLMMEFRNHKPLVYLENVRSGFFLEDREYVQDYQQLLPDLSAVALDEGQSRVFMADLADEYDRGSRKRHADIYQLEEEHL